MKSGLRTKIPKNSSDDHELTEFLMSKGPIDVSKLHEARLKLKLIYDGCFDPSWFKSLEEKATDVGNH